VFILGERPSHGRLESGVVVRVFNELATLLLEMISEGDLMSSSLAVVETF